MPLVDHRLTVALPWAPLVMSSKCPFCQITSDRFVMLNQYSIAFLDSFPISKGHTLVIPLQHVSSIYDLPEDRQADLWHLAARIRHQLQQDLHPDGFNIGLNDGPAAGQTINHAHIHVIPRFKGDIADPRGGIRWVLPEKARYWSDHK